MLNYGAHDVIGTKIHAVDYEYCVEQIVAAARTKEPLTVAALAVHGVMVGVDDPDFRFRLNEFDLVVPDGQPVRWALNLLHGVHLKERVRGPSLFLHVCQRAESEGIAVFLYGSTEETLVKLQSNLRSMFPQLHIAGCRPSAFRRLTSSEQADVDDQIRSSGAGIVLVGLGCPRQEIWAWENAPQLSLPTLAVGAAFDFHAGLLREAPDVLQRIGLEWLFRLVQEPRRLWRRYLLLNPRFIARVSLQRAGRPIAVSQSGRAPFRDCRFG